MQKTPNKILRNMLILIVLIFSLPKATAQINEDIVKTYKIVLAPEATTIHKNIASILERHIFQRSNIKSIDSKEADLYIELSMDQNINSESFHIEDDNNNTIKILGGDNLGLLYGVGKFLRTSRYHKNGFTPGQWRGTSIPDCSVRSVYLATHFNNYYEAAPIEEVVQYIQDLGLWGYNTIIIHYPTWQFDGLQDESSQKWLKRFRTILSKTKESGLKIGLVQAVNQAYKNTPVALLATPVLGNRRGNHGINVCPTKPEGQELLVNLYGNLLDQFKDIGMDYFILWPYDEGGCASEECTPWGANGYLKISREIEKLVHHDFPESKIILSTWCFENEDDTNPDGEWVGLEKSLKKDHSWVDYIMADGHANYFPKYLLEHEIPGNLPLVNFPEISMFGMNPWGGYGTNPAPKHFQMLWDKIKDKAAGGTPYSEGIYEDINKVIIANLYWNRNAKAENAIKEYISFEFSPDVVDDMLKVVNIFEQNHDRKNIQPSAIRAFELVEKARVHLTKKVENGWRWRIFYLRALIDKEIYQNNGKMEGENLKLAFAELTRIYHAENAHSMPIKPPVIN